MRILLLFVAMVQAILVVRQVDPWRAKQNELRKLSTKIVNDRGDTAKQRTKDQEQKDWTLAKQQYNQGKRAVSTNRRPVIIHDRPKKRVLTYSGTAIRLVQAAGMIVQQAEPKPTRSLRHITRLPYTATTSLPAEATWYPTGAPPEPVSTKPLFPSNPWLRSSSDRDRLARVSEHDSSSG